MRLKRLLISLTPKSLIVTLNQGRNLLWRDRSLRLKQTICQRGGVLPTASNLEKIRGYLKSQAPTNVAGVQPEQPAQNPELEFGQQQLEPEPESTANAGQ